MPTVNDVAGLSELIATRKTPYLEVWANFGERSLVALISGDVGWLTLFRFDGDQGLSTMNPNCDGDVELEFRLDNGQVDFYPASFCVELEKVRGAFRHFFKTGEADPAIAWEPSNDR